MRIFYDVLWLCLCLQLIEEVQVKQPEVEFVLERADQLFKDSPPDQPNKVSKSNAMTIIYLLKETDSILVAYFLFHVMSTLL